MGPEHRRRWARSQRAMSGPRPRRCRARADEHAGLAAAVRRFLPEARRQRCTVPAANVGARVPHRRKRVAREVVIDIRTRRGEEAPGRVRRTLEEGAARGRGGPGAGLRGSDAVLRVPRGALASAAYHQQPRAAARRDQTQDQGHRCPQVITAVALRTTHVWGDRRTSHSSRNGGRPSSLAEGEELPPLLHQIGTGPCQHRRRS